MCVDLKDEFTVVYFTSTVQNPYHFLVAHLLYSFIFFLSLKLFYTSIKLLQLSKAHYGILNKTYMFELMIHNEILKFEGILSLS